MARAIGRRRGTGSPSIARSARPTVRRAPAKSHWYRQSQATPPRARPAHHPHRVRLGSPARIAAQRRGRASRGAPGTRSTRQSRQGCRGARAREPRPEQAPVPRRCRSRTSATDAPRRSRNGDARDRGHWRRGQNGPSSAPAPVARHGPLMNGAVQCARTDRGARHAGSSTRTGLAQLHVPYFPSSLHRARRQAGARSLAAIAAGSAGSTMTPVPASSTNRRHWEKSDATTGTPAAMYSKSLTG